MSSITAQISVYPLGGGDVSEKIGRFIQSLVDQGIVVRVGPMSSHIEGESDALFHALRQAFDEVAAGGDVVLTVTFSNACPAWFAPQQKAKKE